jgi:hypothetical protein
MSIVFVVLVAAIIAIIVIGMKSNKSRQQLVGRRIYWLISGYAVILLISAVLAPFLPANEVTLKPIDKSKEILERGHLLYEAAIEGKIEQVDRRHINKTWSFDYHGQQLSLSTGNADFISSQVFVERKAENDGRIEVTYYKTSSYINGMDISEIENPMRLELADETLMLMDPKKTVLEFYQFEKAFPTAQFTNEGWQVGHHTSFSEGQSILYIKVPKELKLIGQSHINFEIVE